MAYDLQAAVTAALANKNYNGNQWVNGFGNAIGETADNASMVILPSGEGKYLTPDGREVPYPGTPSYQGYTPGAGVAQQPVSPAGFAALPPNLASQLVGIDAPSQIGVAQNALKNNDLTNYQAIYKAILKQLGVG